MDGELKVDTDPIIPEEDNIGNSDKDIEEGEGYGDPLLRDGSDIMYSGGSLI